MFYKSGQIGIKPHLLVVAQVEFAAVVTFQQSIHFYAVYIVCTIEMVSVFFPNKRHNDSLQLADSVKPLECLSVIAFYTNHMIGEAFTF